MDPQIFQEFAEGYQLGYSQPDAKPGKPLAEPWLTYYQQGFDSGRKVRLEADAQYDGPTIGPDPGGESWEHYKRRWKELLEPLFHQHMPHTEVEMDVPEPPPINVIR